MKLMTQSKLGTDLGLPASSEEQETESLSTCLCGASGSSLHLLAPDRFYGRTTLYELRRCPQCALVWLHNRPSPKEMSDHYGTDYDKSVTAAGSDPKRWASRVNVISRYKQRGAVLDLGCSSGGLLQALGSECWDLYGVEMSHEVARVAESTSGANVFVGDILDAPWPQNSFDVITCFHLLEHTYEPLEVLKKISRWLKPGGIFYLMVPNIDSAGFRIFGSYWYALELPRHLYHFSPRSLSHLSALAGLECLTLSTHREVFIENSVRYCVDDALRRIGRSRTPLAYAPEPGLPFRVLRKGFRLTLLPLLERFAGVAGSGESIHAIYQKPMK